MRLTSVFGHVHIGREMAGDDRVEEDEDAERQPEEQADDREEECLRPGRGHVGGAAGVGGIFQLVVGDGEDGGGQEDGEQPGDEADQAGLVLGPDEPGPQWQADGVVPSILRYWNITVALYYNIGILE